MYNYIRALHRIFNREADCKAQWDTLENLDTKLKESLNGEEKKLLLCLRDTLDVIRFETSLESFAAGFQAAQGILSELNAHSCYNDEEEENKRICQGIGRGKEGTHE